MPRPKQNIWTPEQLEYIRKNATSMTDENIGKALGMTRRQVAWERESMGIYKTARRDKRRKVERPIGMKKVKKYYLTDAELEKEPVEYDTRSGVTIINRAGERIGKWCPTLRYHTLEEK